MKRKIIHTLIFIGLAAFPILLGLPFVYIYDNKVVIEVSLVVMGLLEWLVVNLRISANNRRLWKKGMTKTQFKLSKDYRSFIYWQWFLFISGLVNVLLSLIFFYFYE